MSDVGVMVVDERGVIVEANENARLLLGDCVGHACRATVSAHDGEGKNPCDGCPNLGRQVELDVEGVVVRGQAGRMVCSKLGKRTIVVITPNGPAWEPLTSRERQILTHVARGFTTAQISQRLNISSATVRTHVEHARCKLGARTRAEAVAKALASGSIQ